MSHSMIPCSNERILTDSVVFGLSTYVLVIESWILAYLFNANANNNIYLIRIRRKAHLSECSKAANRRKMYGTKSECKQTTIVDDGQFSRIEK